jgi:hypothetical protein
MLRVWGRSYRLELKKLSGSISTRSTSAVYVIWFTHNYNIVRGLVGGDNNIFVMKERQVFSNIWVFKDWCRASAYRPTEFFLILICMSDLTLLTSWSIEINNFVCLREDPLFLLSVWIFKFEMNWWYSFLLILFLDKRFLLIMFTVTWFLLTLFLFFFRRLQLHFVNDHGTRKDNYKSYFNREVF